MRALIWPADKGACGHYRLMLPAWVLSAQGYEALVDHTGPRCQWSHQWPGADKGLPPGPDVRLVGLESPVEADVVVLQRPGRRWWGDLIPHLQAQGVRVVVDVDDLFDAIPPKNVAKHGYRELVVNHKWIDRACMQADVVTCSTPALLNRYGYGKGVVLPNLVSEHYLDIEAEKREETIGWTGFIDTHPGDLESTQGAIGQVLDETGWKFHVIGVQRGIQPALKLKEAPSASGKLSFGLYAYSLAELTIGIVPLGESRFNKAKSALKASEMAALGVPVVMAPTPDNLRLHDLGVGLVAKNRAEWVSHLSDLTSSRDYRDEIAGKGKEVMRTQTYELKSGLWWEAWTA